MIALHMLAAAGWEQLAWTLIGQLIVAAIAALIVVYAAVKVVQSVLKSHDRRIGRCEKHSDDLHKAIHEEAKCRLDCSIRSTAEFATKDELLTVIGNIDRRFGGLYELIDEVKDRITDQGSQFRDMVSRKVGNCHERINRIAGEGGHDES